MPLRLLAGLGLSLALATAALGEAPAGRAPAAPEPATVEGAAAPEPAAVERAAVEAAEAEANAIEAEAIEAEEATESAAGAAADGAERTAAERAVDEAALTGRDIYERVLANRFESYTQQARLVSGDRAGQTQETRFELWFKSFRGPDREPIEGDVLSRALVKYTHPFDLRHTGYLVVNRRDHADDQFLYLASTRRVKRVNLRGEAVFGTDFSLEDVLPKEVEDATYERRPDAEREGVPVFVVDVVPKERIDSEYSRFRVSIEKERYVPLAAHYWDDRDLEVKILSVDRDAIRRIEHVWVPMRMRMHSLQLDTYTEFAIDELVPNPDLPPTTFELRRLEGR